MNVFDSLRKIPLFHSLNNDELKKIALIAKESKVKVKSVIFDEGMPGDAMFVIKNGSVRVIKSLGQGKEETLSILGEGEFFGEMALLDGGLRSAKSVAEEDSVLFVINKDDFMNLLIKDGPLAVKFFITIIKVFSLRLRQTDDNFKNILLKYVMEGKK
ncbi:MAG: cyclic nucleotide-binding domain-containing protein [bacterium]|nr:cyclic nucleotide-binding domain-containing protein [bacterium]